MKARYILGVVALMMALVVAGCSPKSSGPSIADQVVAIIKPVAGEPISPPVGEEVTSPDKYLIFRLEAAAQANPDLFKGVKPAGSPAPTGKWLWTFRDGSTMRWIPKMESGSQDIGGPLDRVETTNP